MIRRLLAIGLTIVAVAPSAAQSWRLRLDASAQRITLHPLISDSIRDSLATTGPNGGPMTPDGYALDCIGDGFCRYFRAGAPVTGVPASVGASIAIWGFGIPGLSFRGSARVLGDLGDGTVFPGTTPPVRLIEAYGEYQHNALTLDGGRMLERGRLASVGSSGLDGVRATWRADLSPWEFGAYGGWGMARGTVLPINSPAVDPLADYQPTSRQLVFGALVGAHLSTLDVQGEYRRELDPVTDYIVAERAGIALRGTLPHGFGLVAGADYDIAQAQLGSAELTASVTRDRVSAAVTARHYRPFFDLSTVWGVFSPVPYNGVSATLSVQAQPHLQLRSTGEWFRYDAAGVSVPTVPLTDHGWRWSAGATWTPVDRWTAALDLHGERLPGASSSGVDGRVTWRALRAVDLSATGGNLQEPLELRYQDGNVNYAGVAAAFRSGDLWQFSLDADRYWGAQDRPDAAAFDINQWRLSARVSLTLHSAADRWLPPARLPHPEP